MRKILLLVVAVAILAVVAILWFQRDVPTGGAPLGTESGIPQSTGSAIPPGATEATIDYVHDGDTVFLGDRTKVRLLGINTPEIGDNRECYGDEATAALRTMLPIGSHVWVLADVEPLDQYGRSLYFIYTADGINVNLELLAIGAAEVEQYSPNLLFADELHRAEDAARAADLGLWAACR